MARFVGTAVNRTLGYNNPGGFTRAEVFTTPGTTTWTPPSDATKIKVFAIGAGSEYTAMTHCYASSNCNSGVTSLGCNYCLTFTGHAPGAGGGFAEKTISSPQGTATITVGQKAATEGGTPTDTMFCIGSTSPTCIKAFSARQVSVNYACTGNALARDTTYDLQTSLGFQLPVCGYINCISGYWQVPGCATGGDINRVGGCSIIIPEFLCDSNIRPDTYQTPSPAVACGLANQTGTMFFPGTGSQRKCLQTAGSLCGPIGTGTGVPAAGSGGCAPGSTITCYMTCGYSFYYGGQGCWYMIACAVSGAAAPGGNSPSGSLSISYDPSFKKFSNKPIGLGAGSGLSEGNGMNAKPEAFTVTPIYDGASSLSASSSGSSNNCWCVCTCDRILSTFGSTCYMCYFQLTLPCAWGGCMCSGQCTYNLGDCCCWLYGRTCNCTWYPVLCFPAISASGGGNSWQSQPYFDITYIQTETSMSELSGEVIYLSEMVNSNGTGLSNFKYGSGAGIKPATYGGGGNRCYPAANGAVVILY